MTERTGAVGSAAVEHAAIMGVDVVFRGAVEEHVEMGADVHVAALEGAGEGEDEGDKLGFDGLLADKLDVGGGPRGETAGEGRVAVDVELEEVEEGVVDEGDGAVELGLDAVVELEGPAGLVADGEGNPLDLVASVLDVFTRLSAVAFRCQQTKTAHDKTRRVRGRLTCYGSCTRRGWERHSGRMGGCPLPSSTLRRQPGADTDMRPRSEQGAR